MKSCYGICYSGAITIAIKVFMIVQTQPSCLIRLWYVNSLVQPAPFIVLNSLAYDLTEPWCEVEVDYYVWKFWEIEVVLNKCIYSKYWKAMNIGNDLIFGFQIIFFSFLMFGVRVDFFYMVVFVTVKWGNNWIAR